MCSNTGSGILQHCITERLWSKVVHENGVMTEAVRRHHARQTCDNTAAGCRQRHAPGKDADLFGGGGFCEGARTEVGAVQDARSKKEGVAKACSGVVDRAAVHTAHAARAHVPQRTRRPQCQVHAAVAVRRCRNLHRGHPRAASADITRRRTCQPFVFARRAVHCFACASTLACHAALGLLNHRRHEDGCPSCDSGSQGLSRACIVPGRLADMAEICIAQSG